MTNQIKLDGHKLHQLQLTNKTADAFFHYFGSRGRIRSFTDIKRLQLDLSRQKFQIVEKDATAFFEALQKEGYGKIIYSRLAGGRPRFIWTVDMRTLANAAINEKDVYVEPLKDSLVRECDSPRLKRKQNIGYPVQLMTQVKIKEEDTNRKIESTLTINGETYIKMDSKELERLNKLREMLKGLVTV